MFVNNCLAHTNDVDVLLLIPDWHFIECLVCSVPHRHRALNTACWAQTVTSLKKHIPEHHASSSITHQRGILMPWEGMMNLAYPSNGSLVERLLRLRCCPVPTLNPLARSGADQRHCQLLLWGVDWAKKRVQAIKSVLQPQPPVDRPWHW